MCGCADVGKICAKHSFGKIWQFEGIGFASDCQNCLALAVEADTVRQLADNAVTYERMTRPLLLSAAETPFVM
jgi:hypothetical protein